MIARRVFKEVSIMQFTTLFFGELTLHPFANMGSASHVQWIATAVSIRELEPQQSVLVSKQQLFDVAHFDCMLFLRFRVLNYQLVLG